MMLEDRVHCHFVSFFKWSEDPNQAILVIFFYWLFDGFHNWMACEYLYLCGRVCELLINMTAKPTAIIISYCKKKSFLAVVAVCYFCLCCLFTPLTHLYVQHKHTHTPTLHYFTNTIFIKRDNKNIKTHLSLHNN
jgi:hypothetical protein